MMVDKSKENGVWLTSSSSSKNDFLGLLKPKSTCKELCQLFCQFEKCYCSYYYRFNNILSINKQQNYPYLLHLFQQPNFEEFPVLALFLPIP